MFLCKRVRSEVGVDSVGVGGGEPGGPAGGALRLVVTCPSTSLPLALREWAGVFFSLARSAARRSSMLQTRRPQQFGPPPRRRGSGRGSRRTARLGGWATRSRWWCRGDPAQGRGEGQEGDEPIPGPLPRPPPSGGARGPGSDWRKASRARRAASSSGAVQARAQGGGDPLAVPVGDEPHGWRGSGGPRRSGPWSRARSPRRPRAGRPARRSTRSARPARPCWPDRRTRGPRRRPPPRPGSRSLSHVLDAVHVHAHGDVGRAVRHPVVGADLDADRVEADHRVEGHPEAGAATP